MEEEINCGVVCTPHPVRLLRIVCVWGGGVRNKAGRE